jgi:subtilase family serine protease
VDGGASCGGGSSCGIEDVLDIEDVIGLVPRANVLVYEGPNSDQGAYDTYAKIVSQDAAKVISTSWGICEAAAQTASVGTPAAENVLYQEAAVQGQSIFAAAGDSGAADCGGTIKTPTVDDPASQPYVTGVGGTSLSLGPPQTETVWNDGSGGGASGGGVSSLWSEPSYQSGFAVPQTRVACGGGSFSCREVPDVSADADQNTGYAVFWSGRWTAVGGTSAAAPTWASLLALTEESSSCGGAPLGFLNPLLYRADAASPAADFYDVTSGNNTYGKVTTGWSAGTGYDMPSGLGTPHGANLAASMCQGHDAVSFAGTPGTQHGKVGRPIGPVHVSASSSKGENPITYSAAGLPAGIRINPASGVITGTPTRSGTYAVTILARDRLGTAGRIHFAFVIVGLPSASVTRFHVSAGRATLRLSVRAGQYAPNLRKLTLRFGPGAHLSSGASSLQRYLRSLSPSGQRQVITARVTRGRLFVTFKTPSSASRLRLSGSELTLARPLAKGLSHRTRTLKLTVVMTDTTGAQTRATLKLR